MNKVQKLLLGGLMACAAVQAPAATFVGERTDFRDETIYFAMTTRFYDGDQTNNVCGWDHQAVQIANNDPDWRGDFKGLIDKLDYIKALGFTAIWITPIVQNCSGTDFHGYHAMDFSNVDLRYESRKEWGAAEDVRFQDLIDAAHAKGMKIILDIVLNHTGNFGEKHFAELFYRSQDIRNQASVSASLIPNYDKLPSNYNELDGKGQYNARFPYLKNTDGTNKDNHNYWHHVGTGWNWDYPNRWWGQIAGDCVDLNTENPAVSEYLVEQYGKFIAMGVDGFRIDTTGHISRLTFNTSFIPQFLELGEQYKSKRLNGAPFFMFGECCARFSDVTYRDQPNLSSYFYTWKSPQDLVDQWNWDPTFWDNIFVREGDDSARPGNMALCDAEPSVMRESDNVFMKNGAWHEPDYSDYSGFSIIDFPMHYNFNNAAAAVGVAKSGDKYYNDASFNVVYVDSHDYCPGPNDGTRFNGGTAQWAENLSLMFTFRGIPCIYYGSEVEFKKGMKVDAGGTDNPVKDSGRAYFGAYLEGDVTASDFGQYTASGNVAQTLDGDLSQHIIRLNQIRAAVPALRKGQYTWDGCSANDGWAFKRAYKNESFALVAINGGATFTGLPAGNYYDVVTGTAYNNIPANGSITVSAPSNQGQLRVIVKDWNKGVIGTDGKFIYKTEAVSHGGNPSFEDTGAERFYTEDDAIGTAAVTFSPAGGSFKTETQTVTVALNEAAESGWYKVGTGAMENLTGTLSKTFTIGADMNYGDRVTVTWGATGSDGQEYTGSVTYRKVDPSATITIHVKADAAPNLYIWGDNDEGQEVKPAGAWPGTTLSETKEVNGKTYYYFTVDGLDSLNFILNRNGQQTGNITGITEDVYYEYDGATTATKVDEVVTAVPVVHFSPNGGEFTDDEIEVTIRPRNHATATYCIDGGETVTLTGDTTVKIGADKDIDESIVITWTATGAATASARAAAAVTKTGSVTFTKRAKPEGMTVYFDNSIVKWNPVKIHYWGDGGETNWPGMEMSAVPGKTDIYVYTVPAGTKGVVFNNGNGAQTGNVEGAELVDGRTYTARGNGVVTAIDSVDADATDAPVEFYNMQGMRVDNPVSGFYIMRCGNVVKKVYVR